MVSTRAQLRMQVLHEPSERCAAFMPLQCCIWKGIRIVPMLLDVPTLKRNKFRDPRIMVAKRANFRKGATQELRHDIGRAAAMCCLNI